MKLGVLGGLILILAQLGAQNLEELPELDAPAQAESAWNQIYDELREQPLAIDGRILIAPGKSQYHASARYLLPRAELLVLGNHRQKGALSAGSFCLSVHSPRWETALGNYRFRFGQGIVSGAASRGRPDSLFSLLDPLSPQNYSPLGAAMTLRYKAMRAAVFGSAQKRETRIDAQGRIPSLPKTRFGYLSATQENIMGAAAGLVLPKFQIGALSYWQQYDKDFSDSLLTRSLWGTSVYSGLDFRNMALDGEAALISGVPSALLTFRYKVKNFEQSVSYARNGEAGQLPYALSPGVLSKAGGRDELNFDLGLGLPLKTKLRLRYTLNSGSGFADETLSRFAGLLSYGEHGNSMRLQFHSYDREIISLVDSTYIAADPRNYRFQLSGKYQFMKHFHQHLDFTYTLKDQSDYSQNTYRINFGFGYAHKGLELGLAYLAWQSSRDFWLADDLDPYSYDLYGAEDKLLVADIAWRGGPWRVSVQAQKSLLEKGSHRLWLRCFWSRPRAKADST